MNQTRGYQGTHACTPLPHVLDSRPPITEHFGLLSGEYHAINIFTIANEGSFQPRLSVCPQVEGGRSRVTINHDVIGYLTI